VVVNGAKNLSFKKSIRGTRALVFLRSKKVPFLVQVLSLGQSELIMMSHNYGDCYFCGGEIVERVIELEYRWKGRLYIIEGVPVGICQQCGEKYFTAQVSEAIDRIVEAKGIKRTVNIPVKEFKPIEAL
jgi:YgiT-type zinc finger domain-containing protein